MTYNLDLQAELYNAIDGVVQKFVAIEREACAEIAKQQIGSAGRIRQARGQKMGDMDSGLYVEINAEERGEDIAAEMIAAAIRARINLE